MRKILFIRFGGLGDLLITLPSFRFLRAKFPNARLTLVSRRQYGELLLEAGVVDETIPEDSGRLLPIFKADAPLNGNFSGWLESFDSVIAWTQGSPEEYLRKVPGIQGERAQTRIISADPNGSEVLSRVFYRKTAESFGQTAIPPAEKWSKLPLTGVPKDVRPLIVIHPGSGGETKRWPLPNFLQIIDELGKKMMAGILVTGEAEEDIAPAVAQTTLPLNWNWLRCPSLLEVAKLLRSADLYLGNDSGVTHLAAACGAKVIALFRRDCESAWRPLGRVQMISAAFLSEISMESVRKKIFSETN